MKFSCSQITLICLVRLICCGYGCLICYVVSGKGSLFQSTYEEKPYRKRHIRTIRSLIASRLPTPWWLIGQFPWFSSAVFPPPKLLIISLLQVKQFKSSSDRQLTIIGKQIKQLSRCTTVQAAETWRGWLSEIPATSNRSPLLWCKDQPEKRRGLRELDCQIKMSVRQNCSTRLTRQRYVCVWFFRGFTKDWFVPVGTVVMVDMKVGVIFVHWSHHPDWSFSFSLHEGLFTLWSWTSLACLD